MTVTILMMLALCFQHFLRHLPCIALTWCSCDVCLLAAGIGHEFDVAILSRNTWVQFLASINVITGNKGVLPSKETNKLVEQEIRGGSRATRLWRGSWRFTQLFKARNLVNWTSSLSFLPYPGTRVP